MAEEYPESFPFQKKAAAEGGQVSQGRLRELFLVKLVGAPCVGGAAGGESRAPPVFFLQRPPGWEVFEAAGKHRQGQGLW